MWVHELIGRKITNIYDVLEYESYGLDRGECFIEIDNNLIIDIPYDYYEPDFLEVTIRELPPPRLKVYLRIYPICCFIILKMANAL